MTATTADVVLERFRDYLAATPLPKGDKTSDSDVFSMVPSLEALIGNERDMVTYVQVVQGPYPKPGVRCQDVMRVVVGSRFFSGFESQARMLRHMPLLRDRIRTAVEPHIPGLKKADPGQGPVYDYQSLAKATVSVFDVTLEYEVEVP